MNEECQLFLDALIDISPRLKEAYNDTLDYWAPDTPPVTTMFAAFGEKIADDFATEDLGICIKIFEKIESAMCHGKEELVIAVATGLIEAIVGRLAGDPEGWEAISKAMGECSRKHAEIWMQG